MAMKIGEADPAAAYRCGSAALAARQQPDGRFEGEMVWNTMILSQRVIVGRAVGAPLTDERRAGMIQHYKANVMAEGCWGRHLEGEPSLFCTTLAYVALRLLGCAAENEVLTAARQWIRGQPQGALAVPTWGKLWLALIGLYDYSGINPFPPELFLLPRRMPAHPDQLYCHTRAIYEAIAYLYGCRFTAQLGELRDALADELYGTMPSAEMFAAHREAVSATDAHVEPGRALRWAYRALISYERIAPRRLRRRALARCLRRIHDEQRASAAQGLSPVSGALECLAMHAADPRDDALGPALEGLESWRFEDGAGGVRYAGARSQSWDTAFALEALLAGEQHDSDRAGSLGGTPRRDGRKPSAGLVGAEAAGEGGSAGRTVVRACQYLRRAQLLEELAPPAPEGRSSVRGGWCFSDGSHRWPVSDCTAEAVAALLHAEVHLQGGADPGSQQVLEPARLEAATEFILARQNRDGGFGTYERRRGPLWLETLNPSEMFSNCMVEGSYVECTGSALVALSAVRERLAAASGGPLAARLDEPISRATAFLRRSQLPDGSFAGTWGINYTYGTAFALRGLRAAGAGPSDAALRAAAQWLCSTQDADGGWGEHHSSCTTGRYVAGESQPVMTSWALLGLLDATGDTSLDAVRAGVAWLCDTQLEDGSWSAGSLNGVFFGTGMLHYSLYPAYFPVWALGRYLEMA